MPSGEVAAIVDPLATAQNTDPFQAIEVQVALTGNTRWVQVIPSGEVAAIDESCAIAQNTDPFQAIDCQEALTGNTR